MVEVFDINLFHSSTNSGSILFLPTTIFDSGFFLFFNKMNYEYILSYILLFALFLVFAKAFWDCLDKAVKADNRQSLVDNVENAIENETNAVKHRQIETNHVHNPVTIRNNSPPNYREVSV